MSRGTTIQPGQDIAHFRVKHLIGAGGMGAVYLARDLRLGRKVALKLILPERLGRVGVLDAFLEEMRLTARLNHPHIVSVYDVGEHEGRPWAALEYLEGRSLRQQLASERMSVGRSLRVALAVARALSAAHAEGVLHLDLKPENILLPEDGRVRVVDFGLARPADQVSTEEERLVGTPGYMAPEQWLHRAPTEATDVWALGLCLYEMLSGVHPYREPGASRLSTTVLRGRVVLESEDVPELPNAEGLAPELRQLVAACVDKGPTRRPAARVVVHRLEQLLHGRPHQDDTPPFRGLMPFQEEHARWFHGREPEVARFVERLRTTPTLPVVGPTGSGKSSFVLAGVLPRLRESAYWVAIVVRPGRDPFATLASRLQVKESHTLGSSHRSPDDPARTFAFGTWDTVVPLSDEVEAHELPTPPPPSEPLSTEALAASLRSSPATLNLHLAELALHNRCRVLLVVDQLEEVFTLVPDDQERLAFLQAVCTAADDPEEPVRVVLTVRDDFLGRLAESPAASEALRRVDVLGPLGEEALADTLLRPLQSAGYSLDHPALAREMLAEVSGERAALPLLQFTARALWDRRDREQRLLRRADYQALGGVGGALARHADAVLAGLDSQRLALARQLLLRLVTAEGTRRTLPWSEAIDGLPPQAADVLERLVASRLLSTSGSEGEGLVELAHESLVTTWSQLSRWLAESREEVRVMAEVEEAARAWERRGRKPTDVWRGGALEEALRVSQGEGVATSATARDFLQAGEALAQSTRRRRRLALYGSMAALGAVAVVSVVVALAFNEQRLQAERQAELAETARAEALVAGAKAAATSRDMLQARAQLRASLELRDSMQARALWWSLQRDPLIWQQHTGSMPTAMATATEAPVVAVGVGETGSVSLIDMRSGAKRVLGHQVASIDTLALSPDSAEVAAVDTHGAVHRWDLAQGEEHSQAEPLVKGVWPRALRFLPGGELACHFSDDAWVEHVIRWRADGTTLEQAGQRYANKVGWDAQGEHLASASIYGGDVLLWEADLAEPPHAVAEVPAERRVGAVAFRPDGEALAVLGKTHTLVGLAGEAEPRDIPGAGHYVTGGAWLSDGSLLSVDRAGDVRVQDPTDGHMLRRFPELVPDVIEARLAQGERVFLATRTGQALVDVSPGRLPDDPTGHERSLAALSVSPDGRWVVSGADDGRVQVWHADTGQRLGSLVRGGPAITEVRFHPSRPVVATAHQDGLVRLWRLPNLEQLAELSHSGAAVLGLSWAAQGDQLYTASWNGMVRRWELSPLLAEGSQEDPQVGWSHPWPTNLFDVEASPDGRWLAVAGHTGLLALVELSTGASTEVEWQSDAVVHVEFSRDSSQLLATSYSSTARLWSLPHLTPVRDFEDTYDLAEAALSPDGSRVAISREEDLGIVDLATGEEIHLTDHLGAAATVEFAPDGTLFTGGDDGTVYHWSSEGERLWRPSLEDSPPAEEASAEGKPEGTTATWSSGTGLALGQLDGQVLWHESRDGPGRSLEGLAPSQVVALAAATPGALAVGHANGRVEVVDLDSGLVLARAKLHGPAELLRYDQGRLHVVTRTGDEDVLDLSTFVMSWEALLEEVQAEIPITWDRGVVLAPELEPAWPSQGNE